MRNTTEYKQLNWLIALLNRDLLSFHMVAAPIYMTTYWLPCCEFTPETRSIEVNDCAVLGNVHFATASAQPILHYFSKAKDTIYVVAFSTTMYSVS